ncbi:MAG TPA: molybdopterin-dependent oxidoreductase [Planctomycetaceae bacterium]|jgi:DMSO/TMAO reductase YedYZ molybdopterin-dependent catalytic subunit|nr:molybdopterin-dependent oxidoreductase [Planctomycetaceae bacterium]
MNDPRLWAAEHAFLTRRHFLRLGAAGGAALPLLPWGVQGGEAPRAALATLPKDLQYLTPEEDFGNVERGNPVPSSLTPQKSREVGLTRATWKLEIVSDPAAPAKIGRPLSNEVGTALDWAGLMKLAEKHAVRFLKVMTCNNIGTPLGMGLWEGVPLRTVVWLTQPTGDLRRVFYYGYHNDDPKQRFQSSLPIGRVLEDPPGEYPVILCYKVNGAHLSGHRGGPVRMLVPDAYGFKSVKWLQRVVLSNGPFANDTYANANNDIDSWMKTFARFLSFPATLKAGQPIPITGAAQVGISGLTKVQCWLWPRDKELPRDDPNFATADWKDAQILAPPTPGGWGGAFKNGKLPADVMGFDASGRPKSWPLRYSLAHWAVLLPGAPAGKYDLRCRTIDANGIAQPLPRPFPKSGRNAIEKVELDVTSL